MLHCTFIVWQKIMLQCLALKGIDPNYDAKKAFAKKLRVSLYESGAGPEWEYYEHDDVMKRMIDKAREQMLRGPMRRSTPKNAIEMIEVEPDMTPDDRAKFDKLVEKLKTEGVLSDRAFQAPGIGDLLKPLSTDEDLLANVKKALDLLEKYAKDLNKTDPEKQDDADKEYKSGDLQGKSCQAIEQEGENRIQGPGKKKDE
jgi:hypothetical protein